MGHGDADSVVAAGDGLGGEAVPLGAQQDGQPLRLGQPGLLDADGAAGSVAMAAVRKPISRRRASPARGHWPSPWPIQAHGSWKTVTHADPGWRAG